ncbi:MAG: hypothetical protein KGL16_08315 [Acidobacteriota bacterium]|nr:hypothetical protein [Acidobacteriota bacterium]
MDNPRVQATLALNRAELRRYLERIGDRWRLDGAYLGGCAVTGDRGEQALADLAAQYTVVLVSDAFDEIPWLERVYVAGSLWDALEMGGAADVHCYTRAEFERKRDTMPVVRDAVWHGLDLLVFI